MGRCHGRRMGAAALVVLFLSTTVCRGEESVESDSPKQGDGRPVTNLNPSTDTTVCDKNVEQAGLCLFTGLSQDQSRREISKTRHPACHNAHNGQCMTRDQAKSLCQEYGANLCDFHQLRTALHNHDYHNCAYGWLMEEEGTTGAIGFANEPHQCGNSDDFAFVNTTQLHGAYCCREMTEAQEAQGDAGDSSVHAFGWERFDGCRGGGLQSPVDMDKAIMKQSVCAPGNELELYYTPELHLLGRNALWTLSFEDSRGSHVVFGRVTYRLESIVFKSPSDHTIDGKHAAGELQFVHVARDDGGNNAIGILSVMVEDGGGMGSMTDSQYHNALQADPLYSTFSSLLTDLSGDGDAATQHIKWPVLSVLPDNKDYVHYVGSLTVPPCTEGVNWWVLEHPITTVSVEVIDLFKERFGANQRPVQPLNGRTLARCTPKFHEIQPSAKPVAGITTADGKTFDAVKPSA